MLRAKNVVWLALVAWAAAFASAGSAAAGSAEADWEALKSSGMMPFAPYGFAGYNASQTARERSMIEERQRHMLREQGLAFYENYPADPRRWTVVCQLLSFPPRFVMSYGPNLEKDPGDVVIDVPAAAAWQARLNALENAVDAAGDASPQIRRSAHYSAIAHSISQLDRAGIDLQAVELKPFLSRVSAFAASHPESPLAVGLQKRLMNLYEAVHPAEESAAMWRQFTDSPNRLLAEEARQRIRFFMLATQLAELKFTAVDGREVDLAKLRGKVVLIDFWATWCGPCLEEMPNTLANYQKYHDRGFEVIGIALENANLHPNDSAEQAAAKLANARRNLTDYIATHHLPWPQHFEGQAKLSEISKRYAIESIPTLCLLDQNGRLVSTNARGAALENTLKRLLKL